MKRRTSQTRAQLQAAEARRELARNIREARRRRELEAEAFAAREARAELEREQLSDEELAAGARQAREILDSLDDLQAGGFL